jgi:hypothetical protein
LGRLDRLMTLDFNRRVYSPWYAMAIAKRDQKHVLLDLVVFCFFLGEWSLGTYSYTCCWM